jgi:enterochelin esterase-like enzyme
VDSLFDELASLPILEKKNYLDDWIIHFASTNPIIEETDDLKEYNAYIFVKDDPVSSFSNIYLVGDSFSWDEPQYPFKKIKNTNWFYIKFKRPIGTRIHYLLSINETNNQILDQPHPEKKNWKLDNRNKHTAEDLRIHSIAQFPRFVTSPNLSDQTVLMKELRLPRKLQGTRSGQFAIIGNNMETEPEKLLIVHDGSTAIDYMKIDRIVKYGVDKKRWPCMAMSTLSIQDSDRIQEYGGGRPQYPLYFRDYILPTIEDYLGKSFKPDDIILCGTSLGAWAVFDVLWNNEDHIKNAICQSSPWWWSDDDHQRYIYEISESDKKDLGRLYIDTGIYETSHLSTNTYHSNMKMAKTLEEKGYDLMAKEYLMGHRYQSWAWAFPCALDYIINGKKDYQEPTGQKISEYTEEE